MRPTRTALVTTLTGVVAVFLGTATAAWWAVGDLSHPDGRIAPGAAGPQLSPAEERTAGVLALLLLVLAIASVARAGSLPRTDRRWWSVLLPVVAAGALLALAHRVATAATVGANLGGAFISLPCAALAVLALLWSTVRTVLLLRERRRPAPSPGCGQRASPTSSRRSTALITSATARTVTATVIRVVSVAGL